MNNCLINKWLSFMNPKPCKNLYTKLIPRRLRADVASTLIQRCVNIVFTVESRNKLKGKTHVEYPTIKS